MADKWVSPCGRMELRLGKWQDVLADVTECDAVITDVPYDARTISGFRSPGSGTMGESSREIGYGCLESDDIPTLTEWIQTVADPWAFVFCAHRQWFDFERSAGGWYSFAPVVNFRSAAPRMTADGPATAIDMAFVMRPKSNSYRRQPGSRPGAYFSKRTDALVVGQKDTETMRQIVCDYTLPNDLILEPFAGSGTTLLAAAIEGRSCIGAEMDPKTFDLAVKRLSKGYTPRMQMPALPKPKQGDLL